MKLVSTVIVAVLKQKLCVLYIIKENEKVKMELGEASYLDQTMCESKSKNPQPL